LIDSEVRHLSGGEFQRALLARAIARKPDLMVLDEPVQGVDFAGESALYDLIRSIRAKLWPLGDDVTFVPGHGPTSTFGDERRTNPYVADGVGA